MTDHAMTPITLTEEERTMILHGLSLAVSHWTQARDAADYSDDAGFVKYYSDKVTAHETLVEKVRAL